MEGLILENGRRNMKNWMTGTILFLAGGIGGFFWKNGIIGKRMKEQKQYADKHLELFLMMNQWVRIKQEGKNLALFFEKNGYEKIAIYGMSYAGLTLVSELDGTNVQVMYGIDKKTDIDYLGIDVFPPENFLDNVDVIVITAITYFDEIEEKLSKKINCPIISLEDVLFEV